jgi:hypothetical protein
MPPAAPTAPKTGGRAKSPAHLSRMEFRTASDVHAYAEAGRAISRDMSLEFAGAAHVLRRKLGRKGWGWDAAAARRAARKATKNLRRAASKQADAADCMARFWRDFGNVYGELMSNTRVKQEFDFKK